MPELCRRVPAYSLLRAIGYDRFGFGRQPLRGRRHAPPAGGRTGLASVVTAGLFFLAMFFAPVAGVIPPQATAPALILVGLLMARGLREIAWSDFGEGFPALVTILRMPLTYSITNGIGFGFLSYVAPQVFQGRARRIHPLLWCAALAFLLYFARP